MQANSSESKRTTQGESSLAARIRWVLWHHGLQQQQLAGVMGVKVDRVKSLVLGRASKLRAEEIARLEAAYGLPRAWLVDGTEPAPKGWVPPPAADEDGPPPLLSAPPHASERPPRPYLLPPPMPCVPRHADHDGRLISPRRSSRRRPPT